MYRFPVSRCVSDVHLVFLYSCLGVCMCVYAARTVHTYVRMYVCMHMYVLCIPVKHMPSGLGKVHACVHLSSETSII